MKTSILIIFASCALLVSDELPLTWDYPPEQKADIDVWKLYTTTNLVTPDWQLFGVYTNDPSTNLIVIDIEPGQHYFYLTASNYWGESDSSNIARSKFKAMNINTLKIPK